MSEPVFERLWHDVTSRMHHHGQPAYHRTNDNQGETMNLTEITADAKDAIEQGIQWSQKFLTEHVPALLAAAQRYESSPIVQALEGAVLPPAVEAQIASLITKLSAEFPAAPPVSPPADGPPVAAEPAPASVTP